MLSSMIIVCFRGQRGRSSIFVILIFTVHSQRISTAQRVPNAPRGCARPLILQFQISEVFFFLDDHHLHAAARIVLLIQR